MCHARQEVAVVYTRTNFRKLLDAMKMVVEDTAFIWTRQRVDGQRHERS